MPFKQSAIKHLRQTKKRTARNTATKKNIGYLKRQALKAVEAKDKVKASEIYKTLVKAVDKAAQRNVIKKNTASRKKSRIAKKVNAISAK